MTRRSAVAATFSIERIFAVPRAKVFQAYADPKAKAKWFVGPDAWERSDHKLDFKVGGRESVSGGPPGGAVHHYDAIHMDIVPDERIVIACDMHLDDTRITVSLGTTEFKVEGEDTRVVYTEQIVFLDGHEHLAERKKGTEAIFDNLAAALGREAEAA